MMNRRTFASHFMLTPLTLWVSSLCAQTYNLKATPQDTEGPYYPEKWAGDVDADLVTFNGAETKNGTRMTIFGTVRSTKGELISGATVELWQADHLGKYRHSRDDGEGPAQRGFQGFGRTVTDAQGRYQFRTIKPAVYESRPAHVHFRVRSSNATTLTTQMYFVNENKEGRLGSFGGFSKERDALTVTPTARTDEGITSLAVEFNFVVAP